MIRDALMRPPLPRFAVIENQINWHLPAEVELGLELLLCQMWTRWRIFQKKKFKALAAVRFPKNLEKEGMEWRRKREKSRPLLPIKVKKKKSKNNEGAEASMSK